MDAVLQHGGRARLRRERNILFKFALFVLSLALALFGVLGWADAAKALEAIQQRSWEALDPLWPFYATAAIGCLAAQFVAACAVVNLERLSSDKLFWRGLCAAFYAVAVVFATYSADRGATVILNAAHTAQRQALESEIEHLLSVIERERAKLPEDTGNTMTSRQEAALAIFDVSTKTERDRLPLAREALSDLPAEPARERWMVVLIFVVFLVWAVLEPWGYALAERGRKLVGNSTVAQPRQPFEVVEGGLSTVGATAPPTKQRSRQPSRRSGWLGLKTLGLGVVGWGVASTPQPASLPTSTTSTLLLDTPVESEVARPIAPVAPSELPRLANQMSAARIGERRIAERLTQRYGERITRHQVRIWLGRERTAA